MKNETAIMVRYIGADHARRYLLQRGDFKFWTGDGWDRILDKAKIFYSHDTAGTTAAALQYQQYKGKPIRTFKIEVGITLAADEVENISQEALVRYISAALRIEIENSTCGDGPVDGSFVQARLRVKSLEETKPHRKVF